MFEYKLREFGYLSETGHIHHYLVRLNKLGFYTFSSQPWSTVDHPRGVKSYQLEYVAGLMDPIILDHIMEEIHRLYPTIILSTPSNPASDIVIAKDLMDLP